MTRRTVDGRSPAVGRTVVGTVLVVLGTGIFIEQVSGLNLRFIPFLVGSGLLAAWAQTRCRGLLIGGSIVAAAGVGMLLRPAVGPAFGDAVMNLSLASGFVFIYLLSDPKPTWPLIVSLGLIVLAVLDLGDVSQMIPPSIIDLGLPTVIVLSGMVLIFRDRLSRRVSTSLLVALAVIGVVLSQADHVSAAPRAQILEAGFTQVVTQPL